MPIMAIYRSDQVAPADYAPYEAEIASMPLPAGALLHVVGFDGREMTVVDVWESREAMDAFTPHIGETLSKFHIAHTEPQVFDVQHVLADAGLSTSLLQSA